MPDAWEELIGGSTIQFGDAWEHLLAQGGEGGGGTIIVGGDNTSDIVYSVSANNAFDLSVDSGYTVAEAEGGMSTSTSVSITLSTEVNC